MTDRMRAPAARPWGTVAIGFAMLGLAGPAHADDAAEATPKPTGFWERDTLTGDWGGVRSDLEEAGIKLGVIETSDGFADVSGGARTGATYEGRTELDLDLDLEKLVGWSGATVHAGAWQIHGRGLSGNNTKNLLDRKSVV